MIIKRPFPPAPPGARPAPPLFPPPPWGAPRPGAPWAPVPPGAIPRRIRAPAVGQLGRPPAGHRTAGAADGRGQTGQALSDGQRTTTCRPRPAAARVLSEALPSSGLPQIGTARSTRSISGAVDNFLHASPVRIG